MDKTAFAIVINYIEEHLDKTDDPQQYELYIVWKSKILQNWKYLIPNTTHAYHRYMSVRSTYRQAENLDAYKKFENRRISEETL